MPVKLAIAGAGGRMGKRLLALSDSDSDFTLVQALERQNFPLQGQPLNAQENLAPRAATVKWASHLKAGADVLVDFSAPEAMEENLEQARQFSTAMVIGVTGLTDHQRDLLHDASKKLAIIQTPNFSLGVNLLFRIAGEVAKALGQEYDIEIVEAHHNLKADAPSGTALGLAKSVVNALGRDMNSDLVYGRSGKPGPRTKREIGMHALRIGSVVGDHTVHFGNDFERIELTHRAQNRDVFASGALRAAKWLASRAPGLYTMDDVLFK